MEDLIWLIVPLTFFWVTTRLFERITRIKNRGVFVVATVFSIFEYLFFHPTCGCIGINQIIGAMMLAIPFNLIVFS